MGRKIISEKNNSQVDNAKDINIVMPMYNLMEYGDNYSKASASLWKCCRDISAVNNNDNTLEFNRSNTTDWFNFEVKLTGQTGDNGRKEVEIMVPLKYLGIF